MSTVYSKNRRSFYIPKYKKPEQNLQLRICNYLNKYYPGVSFHSDYAAGMYLTRNQASIRKKLNSGRGWSDIFIAAPNKGYHGLFLELKKDGTAIYVSRGPRKGELVSDEQINIEAKFLNKMNKLGYFARFGVGYDKTIAIIDWYFGRMNESLF